MGADSITEKSAYKLDITTTLPARAGSANLSVLAQIATYLSIPRKQVMIIRGQTTPNKIVRVYK